MKKLFVLIVLAATMALAFNSCAPQHHCPAYGQVQESAPNTNV
jgi:hypothetical protein